jgi:multidrug efflux pump subunit AcrA (membrane-fusion protein)
VSVTELIQNKLSLGLVGLVLVVLGTTAFTLPGIKTPPSPPGRVVFAQRGTLTTTSTPSGTIEPSAQIAANFNGSGTVSQVLVKPGQKVHAGQLLAILSDPSLQTVVERDLAALPISQDALAKAEAPATQGAMQSAQANVTMAQSKLKALEIGGTPNQIAQAQAALDSAQQKLSALALPVTSTVLSA